MNIAALKAAAEKATPSAEWAAVRLYDKIFSREDRTFITLATPAAVLLLIEKAEAADSRIQQP